MICIDNSEWMRNSDFSPSRIEAQQDAVNLICGTKTRQNVENVVGLITTAGRQVEVQVSLTSDIAKILGALHRVQIGGEPNLLVAIQVARLALRHRQNKRQEQRIVIFVGSPLTTDVKELTRLGGQLKKNKIAVDIVSFGEENAESNEEILQAFHKSVNNHDNSNIVTIPPGTSMLSEVLSRTPIVRGSDAGNDNAAGGGGGAGGFDWVDPDVDPELALALRLSMETAEAERKKTEGEGKEEGAAQPATPASPAAGGEDPDVAAAMRLSMAAFGGGGDMDEDEEFQRALQMSMMTAEADNARDEPEKMDEEKEVKTEAAVEKMDEEKKEVDPAYMAELLMSLPGIDPNDPEFKAMLASMQEDKEKKEEDKK